MKELITQEIQALLESKGLAPSHGNKSDLCVDCELLDAKVGSGEKKINYQNSILIDEEKETVFLYEKFEEKSKGFSFGSSSESSFQSGKTLTRHVKGTFMGLNGVIATYDFDIGDVSKSIKMIAQKHGFDFKTVIRRKSAEF